MRCDNCDGSGLIKLYSYPEGQTILEKILFPWEKKLYDHPCQACPAGMAWNEVLQLVSSE